MHIITTDSLPNGIAIQELGSFVQTTYRVQISNKGLFANIFGSKENEVDKAIEHLVNVAGSYKLASGKRPNAIIGVKLSTAAEEFKEGKFLFYTYYGTTAYISADESDQST